MGVKSSVSTDTAAPSQLYEAAVGYLVSDKSQSNAWEQVCQFVHGIVVNKGNDEHVRKELEHEFRVVEKQVKKDYDIKGRMPASWRSAKATALGALKHSIPLVNVDGNVQPKTDVGKLISASKKGSVAPSDFEKFQHHSTAMMGLLMKLVGKEREDAEAILIGCAMPFIAPTPKRVVKALATAGS
jgi:hypothetical protein